MIARLMMAALFMALAVATIAAPSRATAQTSFDGNYAGASVGFSANALSATKTVGVAPAAVFDNSTTTGGFTGTVFVGQNFGRNIGLARHFLLGLEIDGTLSDLSSTVHNDSYRSNWGATFRARFGYEAKPGLLLYATGGYGMLNVNLVPDGLSHASATLSGYVIGGGVELATNLPWHARLRAEYLYSSYGSWSYDAIPTVHEHLAPDLHQLRLGVVIPINH